jgi:hypothetical protein
MIVVRPISRRTVFSAGFTLAAGGLIGCGDAGKVKTFPVRGQVLVDGQPAEHARLVFFPLGGDAQLHRLVPRATTDANGFYELMTYRSGDGAPLGEYQVTAVWKGPLPADAGSEDFSLADYEDRPDRLKGRYESPEKTPLRLTIQGPGDLPPLDMTAK